MGGINWVFNFDDLEVPVRLQIPVNSVMGDTEGHDKAMCRKVDRQGRNEKAQMCRQCNVLFCQIGNPIEHNTWDLTTCVQVREMRNNINVGNNREELDKMGYKFFHDGMVDIHFSDPTYGLHGCTFPEVLHAFQLGPATRTIETCFGTKRTRAVARATKKKGEAPADETNNPKSRKGKTKGGNPKERPSLSEAEIDAEVSSDEDESGDVVEEVIFDPSDLETTRSYVFNAAARRRVDQIAKELHDHLRWQSDRNLPRTTFPSGLTKLAKMQAHERTGVLLVLLLILVLEHWANWRRNKKENTLKPDEDGYLENVLTSERCSAMIKSLYLLLCYEAYMRKERIPEDSLPAVGDFIPVFLDQVFRAFDRTKVTTVGNNTIKAHYPHHLRLNIEKGGSPQNTNSGVGEHLHITAAKETGRNTNMNRSTFELQTGRRYNENLVIDRSYVDHPLSWLVMEEEEESPDVFYKGSFCSIGDSYYLNYSGKKKDGDPIWKDSPLSGSDAAAFIRRILPLVEQKRIALKSTNVRHGVKFTANPCYSREQAGRQNWALVKQQNGEQTPYHLLCFFELEVRPLEAVELNGTVVANKGHYAFAHCIEGPLREKGGPPFPGMYKDDHNDGHDWGTLAHPDQKLIHRSSKVHFDGSNWVRCDKTHPPTLQVIPCDSIAGPLVGFPDILLHKTNRKTSTDYLLTDDEQTGTGCRL